MILRILHSYQYFHEKPGQGTSTIFFFSKSQFYDKIVYNYFGKQYLYFIDIFAKKNIISDGYKLKWKIWVPVDPKPGKACTLTLIRYLGGSKSSISLRYCVLISKQKYIFLNQFIFITFSYLATFPFN